MQRCVKKPFVQRNSMTSSTKFTYDFFIIAKTFKLFSFGLIISTDESQSKAQINLQSLGEK